MRVVMISKALVVGAYRQKATAMASEPDIDLTVVVPPYWREGKDRLGLEETASPNYRLIVTPMARNGSYHTHYYPRLAGHSDCVTPRPGAHRRGALQSRHLAGAARRSQEAAPKRSSSPGRTSIVAIPRLFAGWRIMSTDCQMAPSREITPRREVLAAKGYDGPLAVIPQFGVDPDLFTARLRTLNARDRPFTIGFAGRLVEEKGLLRVGGRAGPTWAATGGCGSMGTGPLRPRSERALRPSGSPTHVSWQTRIPSRQMPAAYADSRRRGAPLADPPQLDGAVRPGADRGDGLRDSRGRLGLGRDPARHRRRRTGRPGGRCRSAGGRAGPPARRHRACGTTSAGADDSACWPTIRRSRSLGTRSPSTGR